MVSLFPVVTIHSNIKVFILPRTFVFILLYYCFRLPYYISILVSHRKGVIAISFFASSEVRRGFVHYEAIYTISPFYHAY
jgi:hypothetical protein